MSDMIVAKTVVDDQFWILQENDRKVGNILVEQGKYHVKINNEVTEFKSLAMVERITGIKITAPSRSERVNTIRGYATGPDSYNETWDVERGLPLFTRVPSGQCWHAAGWYRMKRGKTWEVQECPKLIYLQRYPYQGPFLTRGEAENAKNGI